MLHLGILYVGVVGILKSIYEVIGGHAYQRRIHNSFSRGDFTKQKRYLQGHRHGPEDVHEEEERPKIGRISNDGHSNLNQNDRVTVN